MAELSWNEFHKKHKSSWEITHIDGTPKMLWKCSCGIERLLPVNSGLPLGLKVQSWTHFDELNKSKDD
jgi:hypothetical protein